MKKTTYVDVHIVGFVSATIGTDKPVEEQIRTMLDKTMKFAVHHKEHDLGMLASLWSQALSESEKNGLQQKEAGYFIELALGIWFLFQGSLNFNEPIIIDFGKLLDCYPNGDGVRVDPNKVKH